MRGTIGLMLLAAGFILVAAPTGALAGADEGKAVYEKSCKTCHSIAGDAGKMASLGGKLDGVGGKHDAAWLKEYITNPKSKKPDSKMAKVTLTDQQLSDVVAYLATLK